MNDLPCRRLVQLQAAGRPGRFLAHAGVGDCRRRPAHSDLVEQAKFVHHSRKIYACALSTGPRFDKQFASIIAGLILPYVPSCAKH
jgi:hypothetical protein